MVLARKFGAMINLELTIMTSISNIINRLRLLPALLRRALRGLLHARFRFEQYGPLGVCRADRAAEEPGGCDATRCEKVRGGGPKNKERRDAI
jgi:hypothetical protein